MTDINCRTILLVEDENIIAIIETKILKKYGYNVIHANTGEKALDIMDSGMEIDLVLMNIDLGDGIDGTCAAEIILKNHNIPLAFLSSHTDREIVEKTEGITSYGYIVKNSGETVLHASIGMAFRLFEANEKLRLQAHMLDVAPVAIIVHEDDGNMIYVNNRTLELHRFERDEFMQMNLYDLGIPESVKKIPERISGVSQEGESFFEVEHYRKDGSSFSLEIHAKKILWKGKPAILSMGTDISLRKEAEDSAKQYREELEAANEELEASMEEMVQVSSELRESEEKFRNLAEIAPMAIMMYQNDKWIYANSAAERISGYTEEELKKMYFWDIVAPDYRGKVKDSGLKRQKNDNTEDMYEFKIIVKGGREKWVYLHGVSTEHKNKPAGLISVIDITDLKESTKHQKS